ncbi:hypothetical protein ASC96_31120 [Rhizobium sp. Root1204]|nr:hypothetical protein ASC96_31120 [Rhizobium sp. Root1204]
MPQHSRPSCSLDGCPAGDIYAGDGKRLFISSSEVVKRGILFKRLPRRDVGHGVLLVKQVALDVPTAGLLQLSNGEPIGLGFQPKHFRMILEIGFFDHVFPARQ